MQLTIEQLSALAAACSEYSTSTQPSSTAEASSDASMHDTSSRTTCSEAQPARWCNFLYTSRCPFCTKNGAARQCMFMHIDSFTHLPEDERRSTMVPNLMQKHMRSLQHELVRAVNVRAQSVLDAWKVVCQWGGANAPVNPYHDAVKVLRELGWCLPGRELVAMGPDVQLCDMPYASDVANVLALCARCVHYDVLGAPEAVLRTISWALSLDMPQLKLNQVVARQELDCAQDYSEMPQLLCEDELEPMPMTRRQERRAEYVEKQKAKKQQAKLAKQQLLAKRAATAWTSLPTP